MVEIDVVVTVCSKYKMEPEEFNPNLPPMYKEDEISHMRRKFETFDINEDGGLTSKELKRRKICSLST